MKNEAAVFLLAVQFLTRLPIFTTDLYTKERLAASVRYYPLVGVLVGALTAGIYWLAHLALPHALSIVLSVVGGLLITGGFHEDGLADTFDGVGGGQSGQQALEIMKDSRLGTYGVIALIMALSLKVVALSAFPATLAILALIAGHGLSRLSSVIVIATSHYAREEGTAKPVATGVSATGLFISLLTGLMILLAWMWLFSPGSLLYAICGLVIGHLAMRGFFERKLGGYTGDTLGAVQQASEIGFYLGLAAWL